MSIFNRYREEYDKNPVFVSFLTILSIFFVFFVISAIVTGGDSIYTMLNPNRNDTFTDHFDSIMYSIDRPYTYWGVIYPPLITIFYAILGHFLMPYIHVEDGESISLALRDSQLGILSFLIIMLLTFYALRVIFHKLTKNMSVYGEILFLLVAFSYPFIYALERGNSIILTVVFCFIFLAGYRSENKWIRYLSYAALGCAAGFKLYPAIFALLILRERRYREAAICAVIVLAIMFLPFVFTDGTPMSLFDSVMSYFGKASITGGFMNLNQLMIMIFDSYFPSETVNFISIASVLLVTGLSFIVIIFDKEMKLWKVVAIIACNLIVGPSIGVQYLFVYMSLPIVFFLISEKELTRSNILFVICFVITIALIPGFIWQPVANSVRTTLILLVLILLLGEGLWRIVQQHFERPEKSMVEYVE